MYVKVVHNLNGHAKSYKQINANMHKEWTLRSLVGPQKILHSKLLFHWILFLKHTDKFIIITNKVIK